MQDLARGVRGGVWRRFAAYVPFLAALLAIIFLTAIVLAPSKARAQAFVPGMDRIATAGV